MLTSPTAVPPKLPKVLAFPPEPPPGAPPPPLLPSPLSPALGLCSVLSVLSPSPWPSLGLHLTRLDSAQPPPASLPTASFPSRSTQHSSRADLPSPAHRLPAAPQCPWPESRPLNLRGPPRPPLQPLLPSALQTHPLPEPALTAQAHASPSCGPPFSQETGPFQDCRILLPSLTG